MNRLRASLLLTMCMAVCGGCAGHVVDRSSRGDAAPLEEVDSELREAETDQIKQALVEIAAELETFRLPHRQQATLAKSLSGLPTPSEMASLKSPGPLEGEAYESLIGATEACQTCVSVHADNLANKDSTAFKRCVPILEDAQRPGCRIAKIHRDFTQGALLETGNNLDVAIAGEGFFVVGDSVTGRTVYTRAGNFSVNAAGTITVGAYDSARFLQPHVSVPENATYITIANDGVVNIRQPDDPHETPIGQVALATFVAPDGLERLGEGFFLETDASGPPTIGRPGKSGAGTLRQRCLESSNVNPLSELCALTNHLRMLRVMRWLLLAESSDPPPQHRP